VDETLGHRKELLRTAEELKRLAVGRQNLVREHDYERKNFKPRYNESDQAVEARKNITEMNFRGNLIQNEEKMHQALASERKIREQLAKASHELDERLSASEAQMYATLRPPLGHGVNLTEKDYRQAQRSVPPLAFVMAITGVVFVATVASSNPQLPLWLTVSQSVVGLALPTAIGLRANYFAKRSDRRAEAAERRAEEAEIRAEREVPETLRAEAEDNN
jgi:hypothetical protein